MRPDRAASTLWNSSGTLARAGRLLLSPLSLLYGAVAQTRNRFYDHGLFATHRASVPSISIGNITVGGTGKTTIAAYIVTKLLARGRRPAVLLRGYGADEIEVHELLNPGVPVVASANRVEAARQAVEKHGADVLVLDDAFQHRRIARDCDVVLLSADATINWPSLIPAGPQREPLSALDRADIVIVTRKAASPETANAVLDAARQRSQRAVFAIIHIGLDSLRNDAGDVRAINDLTGSKVFLVSAIADPAALENQIRATGAHTTSVFFRDHHLFSAEEARDLARRAAGHDMAICTLKDAVKLDRLWPRGGVPLWYVSQSVEIEEGAGNIDKALDSLVAALNP